MSKITLGDPALNLAVVKQHTTVVVEPTSQMGGIYDSAEITTIITVNNDQEREVEFILPYPTVKFSASIAVISAGEKAYSERISQVGRIRSDLTRIKPYLQKIGLSEDQYDTSKELKTVAGQFRAGKLRLPQGQITIKIQLSAVIDAIAGEDGVRHYSFKAYSPLPAFNMAGGRVPLTLTVLFKGDEAIRPQEITHAITNPFGDGANPVAEILNQPLGEDTAFFWKWQTDPVVEFTYRY
ncbi:MAG: hypothetical protein Q4B05_04180 [Candidatus Saccharibacteria bacterium]|nr:hypothetical protein [Candidatus Saccharibacteria bacterium]